ncbi:MAG: xanthine dehydrogenase family protein molybdopterin-binding subunit [Thermodesulfobacteriota bacterium]
MSQDASYIGKRVQRVDASVKVTGSAVYGVDVELPGMLYGAALRSPYAHASIIAIDTSAAIQSTGVRAVVTGKDFPCLFGDMVRDQPFLAIDRVRFVGDPVAAVAAETEAEALEALEKIRVQYEELPAVFDPREAMAEGAPLIHPDFETYLRTIPASMVPGTNICVTRKFSLGNVEQGFAEADEIFEDTFSAQALSHATMEPHAAVAQYTPLDGRYTVWSASDRPQRLHKELADALGLAHTQIRFIVPYVGGSFGGKNTLRAEAIAVALARFTHGRPVKVVFSREESITATQTRLAAHMKLTTGVKKDGLFTARRAEIVWDNGAYISNAPGVANRGVLTILGPYRIPNLDLVSRLVYTNNETTGSYRGFGTTQVTWACEGQMDIIAAKLGIDPLTIRLKNAYVEGDAYINGQIMRDVRVKETIEKAGAEIGLGTGGPGPSPTRRRGKGIATMLKSTATPTDSFCLVKVDVDGGVTVYSSSSEIGAGEKTIMAQIAADAVGVPLAAVSVPNPDTAITPYDHGVSSSRTTFHMGNCIQQAGRDVRGRLIQFAAGILKTDPARLRISAGNIIEAGTGPRMTLKELLAKKFNGKSGAVFGEGHFTPAGKPVLEAREGLKGISSIFWMFATHAAEVEVDTETGVVKVLKVAAAHDIGRAINPTGCEQQIEGSVVLGVSNTLFEEFKKERGRILNDGFSDYKLATMEDLPKIVSILVEADPDKEALAVAKGIGEPAAAATAPAIANAIYNAVGIRIKDLPITPDKVLAALKRQALDK